MEFELIHLFGLILILAIGLALWTIVCWLRRWYDHRLAFQAQEKLLEQLWGQHDNLQMHVDWARDRGDHASGRQLMTQLRELGDDIRELQLEMAAVERGAAGSPQPSRITQKYWERSSGMRQRPTDKTTTQPLVVGQANEANKETDSLLRRK